MAPFTRDWLNGYETLDVECCERIIVKSYASIFAEIRDLIPTEMQGDPDQIER